jgi:outer membrane protein TolC
MPRKPSRSRVIKLGPATLQQLGDRISACLERAEQCREAAASEIDERVRQQLLDLEQQWQQVAESYQFIESLERLLLDQRALPPEVEMLPKDFPPE